MRSQLLVMFCAIAALVVAGTAIAACDDPVPTAAPPPVDTAELEQTAERVNTAADRLDGAAQQLEEVASIERSESDAIFINTDALRLLALLSQLEIEIRIIDAIIDPRPDSRPRRWPLEPEDGAALGFAASRLSWLELQLSEFIRSLTKPPPVFNDEQILTTLVELLTEIGKIERSTYTLWQADDNGDAMAPPTQPTSITQTRIERLLDAVGAFFATDRRGAAAIPGATWNRVNALEHLGWAAWGSCFAWNCYGGDDYGPWEFHERA